MVEKDADYRWLRHLSVALGCGWSALFVVVGCGFQLQMYGDGSIFSYAVAVEDAWAFHWRNISGRLFSYLYAYVPAQAYVGWTGDARGGVAIYGLLHFAAPALGLLTTFAIDRSQHRIIFAYASLSTACLCPLVFGAPTELWMAHTLFWPALALCHDEAGGTGRTIAVFALLTALSLTHEGAMPLLAVILATLALRGWRDPLLKRAGFVALAVLAVWLSVKLALPPDAYTARVLKSAAFRLADPANLLRPILLVLFAALAGYAVAVAAFERCGVVLAHRGAATLVAAALAVYWGWFDRSLHADDRYVVRTALLLGTVALGVLAARAALAGSGQLRLRLAPLERLAAAGSPRAIAGALLLVTLVHGVETAKFVDAWTGYKAGLRDLAMGTTSDPELGHPLFVSAERLGPAPNRMAWNSTTPFLSILVAPDMAPMRLVVDPSADYFWLPCDTARQSELNGAAVPAESRRLIRLHACLNRP